MASFITSRNGRFIRFAWSREPSPAPGSRTSDACSAVWTGLACIYSRYDSANGFYYPLANHGRLAAGYVGLCSENKKGQPYDLPVKGREDQDGLFASLTKPPDLLPLLAALQKERHTTDKPWIVNLDASRFIYEGAAAVGGGHDDIFKDDLIHLVWGIINL